MVEDQTVQPMPLNTGAIEDGPMPDKQDASKFILWWSDTITSAKQFHKPAFDRMYEDMDFVRGNQWPGQTDKDDRYVVNIAQSEVAASVATLYAKNPTFTAKRRPRMDFAIWDENPESLMQAQTAVQQAMMGAAMPDPSAAALLMDVQQGQLYRQNMDRISRTLELVFKNQVLQQQPDFKREMKQLIRRVETCAVGYLKLDFQRSMEVKPEAAANTGDIANRLAHLENLMKEIQDEGKADYEKEAEELRISLKTLQEQHAVIQKEGLLLHFPRATRIIIDPACFQLRGFVGARWIAEEFHLPSCRIKEIYGKDVSDKAKSYGKNPTKGVDEWRPMAKSLGEKKSFEDLYCVWEVYHKDSGAVFTICEGTDEYLKEPAAPNVLLERFFPYYSLAFNDIEDESCIFAPSTVRLIRHQQKEYNRAKEALRQHRIASKPHYLSPDGSLDSEDMTNMENAPAHAVIKTKALQPGQKAEDILVMVKKHSIDQNVYETATVFDDIKKITRRGDPRYGGTSKATATADTIAEDSRQGEDRSKVDDIDDFLTEFARDAGNTLLMQMSGETVKKIAGPGAAWPESDPAELLQDLFMDVQAGSSGRPNRALEVATFERLFPLLIQTPGIKPDWLAKTSIKLADSNIDLTEAYLEGLPSIQMMNKMAQQSTGNPETDPNAQGDEGADKNPRPEDPGNEMTINSGLDTIPDQTVQNTIL